MTAITASEQNLVEDAWRGKYPYQVRVAWDELHRLTSSRFPRIETNETLSRSEFEEIAKALREEGDRLILPEWGSRAAAYADDTITEPDNAQITAARKELKTALDSEPPESIPVDYNTVEQIARERAFREAIRDAYDERCAVCGTRRETPDGRPEVEASHIRPKSEDGPDDLRNGIALCKLHHWAFDNGWFTITDDYRISVTDSSSRDGYTEFASLDGKRIELPDDHRMRPAVKYLNWNT
ncbi:HNH endonuclease [Haloarcula sp. KBTZ06]|uniref:HNH endonuclease n=1 Tax=Haloarcula sp. KBTZ06 TaxID=3402682 RepID=UPI003B438B07